MVVVHTLTGPIGDVVPGRENHERFIYPSGVSCVLAMSEVEVYAFVCPECDSEIEVDASMRDALLANGCVICGGAIAPSAFS